MSSAGGACVLGKPSSIKGVTKATRAGPFRPLPNEQSGLGTSQPCALHKTETAAVAVQPPGATWRHYNPEEGERVMRKAVLARCEAKHTPQQPNIADKRDRLYTTIPLVSHKNLTALSFASISTSRRLSNHEDLNHRMPPPGGPSMHRAGLLCKCYVT
jgi:hypothetical protein